MIKLFLFLLYTSMVDLLKVFLLAEFIICGASLLGYDTCFIELLLKHLELVGKLGIFTVDLRNVWDLAEVELALGLFLKPFLLEVFERLLHAELDEEITEEFIG